MVSLLDKLSKPLLVGGLAIMSYLPLQQNVTAQDLSGLVNKVEEETKEGIINIPESCYYIQNDRIYFRQQKGFVLGCMGKLNGRDIPTNTNISLNPNGIPELSATFDGKREIYAFGKKYEADGFLELEKMDIKILPSDFKVETIGKIFIFMDEECVENIKKADMKSPLLILYELATGIDPLNKRTIYPYFRKNVSPKPKKTSVSTIYSIELQINQINKSWDVERLGILCCMSDKNILQNILKAESHEKERILENNLPNENFLSVNYWFEEK